MATAGRMTPAAGNRTGGRGRSGARDWSTRRGATVEGICRGSGNWVRGQQRTIRHRRGTRLCGVRERMKKVTASPKDASSRW